MMNRNLIAPNQTGFSLIEALIAALVVGIGLLGLARLQSSFFTDIGESRIQNTALHYAQRLTEDLRGSFSTQDDFNISFGTLGSSKSIDSSNNCDPTTDSRCAGINATLTPNGSIIPCTPDTSLPCRMVNLTVDWKNPTGKGVNIPLVSYIAWTDPVNAGLAIANLTP